MTRPDPDALLRRVQADEARARRGKLKVFFGFAPGVGKTYRMLQVARDLVTDHHRDVVVGLVEDHRRAETAAMTLGLELLPRRAVEYRGRTLEEFDLDAALRRKPSLLLLDELAHTNAPGSRHARRWQDVEELLDAGIDVFTTLNVQHVESLNDVVALITGVQVRETVPDAVLDTAEAIELVDIAPEELLARLRNGKVYLGEQAQRAAEHFFQHGNLLALRELALRRTAQHVDEDVREYREAHGVSSTWPAGERLLVCVGAAPSSDRLIRTGARLAAGLRAPWVAAWVDAAASPSPKDRERLETHLRLAESLGATTTRLSGHDVAATLLDWARRHNVTRILIGKPTHSRLRDRLRGSLLDAVVRGSGDIDVHVINGDAGPRPAATERPPDLTPAAPRLYVASAGLVAVTLLLSLVLRREVGLPDLEMLFLLAVMGAAASFGRGPALLAAALGTAAYDFFFVEPLYTFSVDDRRYVLTFAMMFGVGLAISELTSRLRRQERAARAREERTATLYALTRALASAEAPAELATLAARQVSEVLSARVLVLGAADEGHLAPLASWPPGTTLDPREESVARWAHEHRAAAGAGTDTLHGASAFALPLTATHSGLGALVVLPSGSHPLRGEQRDFLDVAARQLAVALERARLSREARQSALRARAEELRSALLSTVSHDLRTPLASITGAATVLRDDPALSADTRAELLEAIVDQAARLERLVGNLLDMTRLDSGQVSLHRDWVPLEELVGSSLTRLEPRLEDRAVRFDLGEDVPPLHVDPVLFEQVFVNLLENADKYTPQGSPLEFNARREGEWVRIELSDRGPGLPEALRARAFEKFFRGSHPGVVGAGLGLAICRAIVEAHGGTIEALAREGGGATFRIRLPCGAPPPAAPLPAEVP